MNKDPIEFLVRKMGVEDTKTGLQAMISAFEAVEVIATIQKVDEKFIKIIRGLRKEMENDLKKFDK